MQRTLFIAALLGAMGTTQAQEEPLNLGARPPLVVGITVDQMRADYLYRFWNDFGEGGFKRIVEGGFVCADHHFGYAPTYTGPGHASIFTGTTPAYHGIIANDWYDRASGGSVYCASDTSVRAVGAASPDEPAGFMSPHRLQVTTLGDELKLATGGQAKVIGMSMKDRGAILPAGHSADGAFWFHGKDEGAFISSTYYYDELPDWAARFNRKSPVDDYMKDGWKRLLNEDAYDESQPDSNPYESPYRGTTRATFPYDFRDLAEANRGYDLLKGSPAGNALLVDFALAAIAGEDLGGDAITDLLAISFSSTDYVGHQFGVHAQETQDIYLRLDRELARLFTALDEAVGAGNWVCWLSADHAGATVPSLGQSVGMPVDYWKPGNMTDAAEAACVAAYGEGPWILQYSNDQFFLDRARIAAAGLNMEEVAARVRSVAMEDPDVYRAVTRWDLAQIAFTEDPVLSHLQWGHHPTASGEVIVVPKPGWINYGRSGTTHGSPYAYDTHVPCIFYGWGVKPGATYERTYIRDIAPTVSALIHSPLPNAAAGHVIDDLFD
jgi:predicted AlkP superfamily pyrophosphatase or phosphodiesterase